MGKIRTNILDINSYRVKTEDTDVTEGQVKKS